MISLACGICFADSAKTIYKDRLNDGIEIVIVQLEENKIAFTFKQNDKTLLSGEAVNEYAPLVEGVEIDEDENGVAHASSEYFNTANNCLYTFRIQNEPETSDEDDGKRRLRIKANKSMEKCDTYKSLEDVIFFRQGELKSKNIKQDSNNKDSK